MPCARLGCKVLDAVLHVVVCLCQSGIPFVAAEGAHVLPFEVDLRRGLEIPLQAVRSLKGRRSVQIDEILPDLLRYPYVLLQTELLFQYGIAEQG
ncbi:hypothetical protein SDC9_153909 [bioreactor metagenome]|uniref:Uncharacterized protein n=1 Tax=bioreactor metagenome TaxID=1076179 RepID=A0A645F1X7_9ZZZZ